MSVQLSNSFADRRIYLLADHLDAVLAAGEDLCRLRFSHMAPAKSRPSSGSKPTNSATGLSLNHFVQQARCLEINAMGRIKQAREHAQHLSRVLAVHDHRFAPLAGLFVAGTAVVVDAIDDVCDSERHAFADGFDPLVFLRVRGLISEDEGCLNIVESLQINDEFLLAGQIELGALLDMCSQFLDVLTEHFELFPEIPAVDPVTPPATVARPS